MAKGRYIGLVVSGIALPVDIPEEQACKTAADTLRREGIDLSDCRISVYKRSVDARKKNDIKLVYSIAAGFSEPRQIELPTSKKYRIAPLEDDTLAIAKGEKRMSAPPLVVGMGPAGLFCALLLAENGYAPLIIDRGEGVRQRSEKYRSFARFGILDTESNIQFGAGGAGTFSDGKLVTRINDPRIGYVLDRFCSFGAPEEIKVLAKPHVGTDLLLGIVEKMLQRIEELGGRVLYNTRLDDIARTEDGVLRARTNRAEILASAVVLATGHSARDTYKMLIDRGYAIEAKPFSVGVRIEHLRKDIDRALYGDMAGHPRLGKGEYHLSDTQSGRGVYTFCMCPGGQVVAAASEEGGVVVNGMSLHARDGVNSNSAVAVSVRTTDYDGTPMGAIEFQRRIERRAFVCAGGDYSAPIMTVGDLLGGGRGSEPSRILPTYPEGRVRVADMTEVLPPFVTEELRRGLHSFERRIKGFAAPDAILTGAETRTSAPVRILRGEDMCALGNQGVYPAGEGAGYAGGITSAAIDGIKVALKIMETFAPAD